MSFHIFNTYNSGKIVGTGRETPPSFRPKNSLVLRSRGR